MSSTSGYCASRTARYTFHVRLRRRRFADERRGPSEDAPAGEPSPERPVVHVDRARARGHHRAPIFLFERRLAVSVVPEPLAALQPRGGGGRHVPPPLQVVVPLEHEWRRSRTRRAPLWCTCDMLALAAAADVLSSRAPRERTEDGAGKCTQLNRCCTSGAPPTARLAWQSLVPEHLLDEPLAVHQPRLVVRARRRAHHLGRAHQGRGRSDPRGCLKRGRSGGRGRRRAGRPWGAETTRSRAGVASSASAPGAVRLGTSHKRRPAPRSGRACASHARASPSDAGTDCAVPCGWIPVPSSVAVSARCRHFFQRALTYRRDRPNVTSTAS